MFWWPWLYWWFPKPPPVPATHEVIQVDFKTKTITGITRTNTGDKHVRN